MHACATGLEGGLWLVHESESRHFVLVDETGIERGRRHPGI